MMQIIQIINKPNKLLNLEILNRTCLFKLYHFLKDYKKVHFRDKLQWKKSNYLCQRCKSKKTFFSLNWLCQYYIKSYKFLLLHY